MLIFSGKTGRHAVRPCCEPLWGHTHWIGGRSLLCPGEHQACPACGLGYRQREARWLSVLVDDGLTPKLWPISPKLADILVLAASRYDGNPVGHVVIIERTDVHRPWDVVGTKRGDIRDATIVTDLHRHVARLFGIKGLLTWDETLTMSAIVLQIEAAIAYEDRRANG